MKARRYNGSKVPYMRAKRPLERPPISGRITFERLLNEFADTPAGTRILKIVELCKRYAMKAEKARRDTPKGEIVHIVKTGVSTDYLEMVDLLDPYRFRLELVRHPDLRAKNGLTLTYRFDQTASGFDLAAGSDRERTASRREGQWALTALEMLVSGKLDKLKRCNEEGCNRWFLADRTPQKYCTKRCRRRANGMTDKARESNRNYQRTYYAEHFSSPRVKRSVHQKRKRAK
jgi:hypothetical protein